MVHNPDIIIRSFHTPQSYEAIWDAMRQFTVKRKTQSFQDEIWLLEHLPVYTLGQAGKTDHILNTSQIPIIRCDRGGQVTYHGPGQLMAYLLFDLNRLSLNTRTFVCTIETLIIDFLAQYNIKAFSRRDAPGVYIGDSKICSIGLRIKHGFSYHGFAFNINMDLNPFSHINPCGFKGLQMTKLSQFVPKISINQVKTAVIPALMDNFRYNHYQIIDCYSLENLKNGQPTTTL